LLRWATVFVTTDVGQKVERWAAVPLFVVELGFRQRQCRLGRGLPPYQVVPDPSSRWATIDMGRKVGAAGCSVPFRAGAGSPSNTMSPGLRPTSVPSGILIHPTVCSQYTNVTDRQDKQTGQTGQRSSSIGRTVSSNGSPSNQDHRYRQQRRIQGV